MIKSLPAANTALTASYAIQCKFSSELRYNSATIVIAKTQVRQQIEKKMYKPCRLDVNLFRFNEIMRLRNQ